MRNILRSLVLFPVGCQSLLLIPNFHSSSFGNKRSGVGADGRSGTTWLGRKRRACCCSPSHHSPKICQSAIFGSQLDNVEAYVGPIGSLADMEGGIAIGDLSLHVLAGPSLVAKGRGLFMCIYDEWDTESTNESENVEMVEEIIIPQGTPLCGYARGYFSDTEKGDKSVAFLLKENSARDTAVFYNQRLMTVGDAIWSAHEERCQQGLQDSWKEQDVLWGHLVTMDHVTQNIQLKADENFSSRIFIPDTPEENQFSATSLGVYANDLAYDPDSSRDEYYRNSEKNNLLQLVWRLAKDEETGMLVPTWPVVVARKDIRLVNTVPMEVGLEYGFQYWDAFGKLESFNITC